MKSLKFIGALAVILPCAGHSATFEFPTPVRQHTLGNYIDAASTLEKVALLAVCILAFIGLLSFLGRLFPKPPEDNQSARDLVNQRDELLREKEARGEADENLDDTIKRALRVAREEFYDFPEVEQLTNFTSEDGADAAGRRQNEICLNYPKVSRKLSQSLSQIMELEAQAQEMKQYEKTLREDNVDLDVKVSGLKDDLVQAEKRTGDLAMATASDEALRTEVGARFSKLRGSGEGKDKALRFAEGLLSAFEAEFPDQLDELKSIAHVSAEQKRISQYDAILRLYNEKLQALRTQEDLDEEDREEAIIAMKRLRDREIEHLEQS